MFLSACTFLALGFSIEGPSQAKIAVEDNGDGSANVSYLPTAPGEYAIHVLCDEEDIHGSPWMATIKPASTDFDASKVYLSLFLSISYPCETQWPIG